MATKKEKKQAKSKAITEGKVTRIAVDQGTAARRAARNVLGSVKSSQVIAPKAERKKEKHRKDPRLEAEE